MRDKEPFQRGDLRELRVKLLSRADEVVAMREIAAGEHDPLVIGLRHDVDNRLDPSVELAEWEARRGYRATYYVLHDSPYWDDPDLEPTLATVAELGHEIGFHCNAVAESLRTGVPTGEVIHSALGRLRSWGHRVTGVVAHGDALCHRAGFVNDEVFTECARPSYGEPNRVIEWDGVQVPLDPLPLATYGLSYDANRLSRALYLSDSGGSWCEPFDEMVERFPSPFGQLHILLHPCWWVRAFQPLEAAA